MHNNIYKKKINKTYIPAVPIFYFSKNCCTAIPYPKTYPCFLNSLLITFNAKRTTVSQYRALARGLVNELLKFIG